MYQVKVKLSTSERGLPGWWHPHTFSGLTRALVIRAPADWRFNGVNPSLFVYNKLYRNVMTRAATTLATQFVLHLNT